MPFYRAQPRAGNKAQRERAFENPCFGRSYRSIVCESLASLNQANLLLRLEYLRALLKTESFQKFVSDHSSSEPAAARAANAPKQLTSANVLKIFLQYFDNLNKQLKYRRDKDGQYINSLRAFIFAIISSKH